MDGDILDTAVLLFRSSTSIVIYMKGACGNAVFAKVVFDASNAPRFTSLLASAFTVTQTAVMLT